VQDSHNSDMVCHAGAKYTTLRRHRPVGSSCYSKKSITSNFKRSCLMRNVVIIGSGCAGNTAAIYSARANLKPLVVSGHEAGGQLSLTTLVENFPGFPEGINGPDLVENMRKQAQNFGAEYVHGSLLEADLSKRPFRLLIEEESVETRTLIVA